MRLSAYEVGMIALAILRFKIWLKGADLRTDEYHSAVKKIANQLKCSTHDVDAFSKQFLIPIIGLEKFPPTPNNVSNAASVMALRILEIQCFWDIRNIGKEVRRISEETGILEETIAAIASRVLKCHADQVLADAKIRVVELEVVG